MVVGCLCNTLEMEVNELFCKALYGELFEVICEVVCVKRITIRIAGEDYPYELVKSKFLKLNSGHLEYVIGCMHDTNTKITNIKAYMVSRTLLDTMSKGVEEKRATKKALSINHEQYLYLSSGTYSVISSIRQSSI